jgi:16S rRNA (cytosine1402-N4)-methyltransferase
MSDSQLALPGMLADAAVEWVWCEESEDVTDETRFVHRSVMTAEVIGALVPRPGGVYLDATFGAGGHTAAILETTDARVIAFDRDDAAVEAAARMRQTYGERLTLVHTSFGHAREELARLGVPRVDGLLADLGVSSPQLDDGARGMSFRREGPLDMRMDRTREETAASLIDRLSDEELADVLFRYGDEHRSRRIARSIKRALTEGDLRTTLDLRRAIVRAVGPVRVGGVDPATRSFQALRIAVNEELTELETLLGALPEILAADGVAAFLSFHSLEDRLVKRAFLAKETYTTIWKKPRLVADEETAINPRARSAKLRAARYIGGP